MPKVCKKCKNSQCTCLDVINYNFNLYNYINSLVTQRIPEGTGSIILDNPPGSHSLFYSNILRISSPDTINVAGNIIPLEFIRLEHQICVLKKFLLDQVHLILQGLQVPYNQV